MKVRILTTFIFTLFALQGFADSKIQLGIGFQGGSQWLSNEASGSEGSSAPTYGFEARLAWQADHWGLGIITSGRYGHIRESQVQVNGIEFDDNLKNRVINYGLEIRRQWSHQTNEVQYVFSRFLFGTSDLNVEPDDVVAGSFDENNDVFLRGYGASLGYGRSFKKYFYLHALFQWVQYDRAVIIRRVIDVNEDVFSGALQSKFNEYSFLVSIGLHNLF